MAQKSIFGMSTLNISAGHQYSSHSGTTVVDISGASSNIESFKAPFDCKLIKILDKNNTFIFQNTSPVQLPIGTFDKVCFRCTHMNNDQKALFSINQTFNQGDVCYYEGTAGVATGNHIHIEFAVGTFVSLDRITSSSTNLHLVTDLTNISGINNNSCNLYLPQAVYIDPTVTSSVISTDSNSNYYTNQYVWTLKNGLRVTNYYLSYYGTGITNVAKNMKMVLTGSAARLRTSPVSGSQITLVPNGAKIDIIRFNSNVASDGYRWAYGSYNGNEGYFQYDPTVMHPEGSVGTLNVTTVKMKLTGSAARIRVSQVGSELITVSNGNEFIVDEFNDAIASDGYRWARVKYDLNNNIKYTGWIQYDPEVMHPYSIGY